MSLEREASPETTAALVVAFMWWFVATAAAILSGLAMMGPTPATLYFGGANVVALALTAVVWKRPSFGFLVLVHTSVISIAFLASAVNRPLALASIALMLAAAEAGHQWWNSERHRSEQGAAVRVQPSWVSPVIIAGLAGAVAALATASGQFETTKAFTAAVAVFAVVTLAVTVVGRASKQQSRS